MGQHAVQGRRKLTFVQRLVGFLISNFRIGSGNSRQQTLLQVWLLIGDETPTIHDVGIRCLPLRGSQQLITQLSIVSSGSQHELLTQSIEAGDVAEAELGADEPADYFLDVHLADQ